MNTYNVKQKDLIGQLEGYPIEVVQKMVDEQAKQWNNADVSVFQRDIASNDAEKGFNWNETIDGLDFWESVIIYKNFVSFFEKYPRDKKEKLSFYKYYFRGCKDGKKIFESISNKLPQIVNIGKHSCKHEAHLYFILEDFTLCHCGLGAEDLLKQLGYEEIKYELETVKYNGKTYIKTDFENAINDLKEVSK